MESNLGSIAVPETAIKVISGDFWAFVIAPVSFDELAPAAWTRVLVAE